MSRQDGFTLLEILLALLIGLLLMSLAVPSIGGMLREQRLKATIDAFDTFVRKAQERAVTDRRSQVMVWDETGIQLVGYEAAEGEPQTDGERFDFPSGAKMTLERPAALVKKPVWEWPFWRSGACEPVIVRYAGPEGTWAVEYNGLTARGRMLEMEVK